METPLFTSLCSVDNLVSAFEKAAKRKSLKTYVITFQKALESNITLLRNELLAQTYRPKPLETFIIRDPKTRKISKSDFRDRVVHHALCTIIEPLFDKTFIHDNYANRPGKGSLKAIARFDTFKRKVSKNNTKTVYVLKADIRHYFATIDHAILLSLLQKKVTDTRVLHLIQLILANHSHTSGGGANATSGCRWAISPANSLQTYT